MIQAAQDDPFERARDGISRQTRGRRDGQEVGAADGGQGVALVGRLSGQYEVQHRPDRKDVGAGIDALAFKLLR
jgi:hypothetical protein